MIMYKLIKDPLTKTVAIVQRLVDNAYIPFDESNTDYQAYLKFLADGGTPLPAEEQA